MTPLSRKQMLFTRRMFILLDWLFNHGYEVTLGEAWRSDATAKANALSGAGISNSLHKLRLAVDLNLWRNDILLTATADYAPAGIYWESLSTPDALCCWGGRFDDGDHFSIENNGVR